MKGNGRLPIIWCLCIALVMTSSDVPIADTFSKNAISVLEKGDWVFRRGRDVDSNVINVLNDGQFSHMGMVIATPPQVTTLHTATDDNPDHPNQVILSNLAPFFRLDLTGHFAIVLSDFLTKSQKKIIIPFFHGSYLFAEACLTYPGTKHRYLDKNDGSDFSM